MCVTTTTVTMWNGCVTPQNWLSLPLLVMLTPITTPGSWHYSFVFSRILCQWKHTICNLLRLVSLRIMVQVVIGPNCAQIQVGSEKCCMGWVFYRCSTHPWRTSGSFPAFGHYKQSCCKYPCAVEHTMSISSVTSVGVPFECLSA